MSNHTSIDLSSLYLEDETAWLDEMAALVAERRLAELDLEHLEEYLTDMARRDRREVYRRLVTLLVHLLKWEHQPAKRTGSWRGTILEQSRALRLLLESGVLRNHASSQLTKAYQEARQQAAVESKLPIERFPAICELTLEEIANQQD